MAGATVEITGSSTVGDVVARDLARAKASLDDLEKGGVFATAITGGIGGILGGLLNGLPGAAEQIAAAIRTALDQIAALPATQIKLVNDEAMGAIRAVQSGLQALADTYIAPLRITADNSDVFAKAKAVEARLAQIPDRVVTITVNVKTNGTVPEVGSPPFSGASAEAHAAGTLSSPGGLALVGERGPELVNLPRGAQVFDALDTRQATSAMGRGGDTYISALYITAPNNASLADLLRQAQSLQRG